MPATGTRREGDERIARGGVASSGILEFAVLEGAEERLRKLSILAFRLAIAIPQLPQRAIDDPRLRWKSSDDR